MCCFDQWCAYANYYNSSWKILTLSHLMVTGKHLKIKSQFMYMCYYRDVW